MNNLMNIPDVPFLAKWPALSNLKPDEMKMMDSDVAQSEMIPFRIPSPFLD